MSGQSARTGSLLGAGRLGEGWKQDEQQDGPHA